MTGRMIDITASDGGSFKGYLAVPKAGSGPGRVRGQEIFGVNPTMRATADYFAEEGYTVLVPDMFWRIEPYVELTYSEADFAKAFGYMGQFDIDLGIADIGAAMETLSGLAECTGKVGYMGFCLGGKLAYLTAARLDPAVAISFYGVGLPDLLGEADKITCPMVFHCPALDKWLPPEGVATLCQAFVERTDIEVYTYPGADHGFYNQDREVYDKPSVSIAGKRPRYCWHLGCILPRVPAISSRAGSRPTSTTVSRAATPPG